MDFLRDLLEALKPSEYRSLVKGWDKSKYEDLFRKYTTDRKAFRIYIPLKGEAKKVEPDPEIAKAVQAAGYEIEDYVTGIASKDDGRRKIKIGKLLKDPKLQQKFANDPKRQATKSADNYVVISRHPYDLAGMSTNRGWRSCMNLHDGVNAHYVPIDIKEGTLIAYLVKSDDKNINNPMGRVLIKPFVNVDKKAPPEHRIAFGIEGQHYGTIVPGFMKTVENWVNEVNKGKGLDGLFQFNRKLYQDYADGEISVGPKGDFLRKIKRNPQTLEEYDDPTPEMIEIALDATYGKAILYLKKRPSHEVLDSALEKIHQTFSGTRSLIEIAAKFAAKGWLDDYAQKALYNANKLTVFAFPNATEEQLLATIKSVSGYHLRQIIEEIIGKDSDRIDKYPEKVQWALIDQSYSFIAYIKKPSIDLILHAVKDNPDVANYIQEDALNKDVIKKMIEVNHEVLDVISHSKHIDDDLVRYAMKMGNLSQVSRDGGKLYARHLKDPTEDENFAMVERSPGHISEVKKPSEALMMWVAEHSPQSFPRIKHTVKIPDNVMMAYIKHAEHFNWLALDSDRLTSKYKIAMINRIAQVIKKKDPQSKLDDYISGFRSNIEDEEDPKVQMAVFKVDPTFMKDIDFITHDVQVAMVKANIKYFNYISHPTEAVAKMVLKERPHAIKHIKSPTPEEIKTAVDADPDTVVHIEKAPFNLLVRAVRNSPTIIDHLNLEHLSKDEVHKLINAGAAAVKPEDTREFAYAIVSLNVSDEVADEQRNFPEKTYIILAKKDPYSFLAFPYQCWTKGIIQAAMDACKSPADHATLIEHVKRLLKNSGSKAKKMLADRGITQDFIKSEMIPAHRQSHEEDKAIDKQIKERIKASKIIVLKSGTKKEDEIKLRNEIAHYVKTHRAIEELDHVSPWTFRNSSSSYITTAIKNSLSKLFDPRHHKHWFTSPPSSDWTFDTLYFRKQKNSPGQIAFYRDGHPVGYYDVGTGKSYWKSGHKPRNQGEPVTITEKKKSFKTALQESFKDEDI